MAVIVTVAELEAVYVRVMVLGDGSGQGVQAGVEEVVGHGTSEFEDVEEVGQVGVHTGVEEVDHGMFDDELEVVGGVGVQTGVDDDDGAGCHVGDVYV